MVPPAHHFRTLDALRGVAAVSVMLLHDDQFGASLLPGGYLAVDLFFLLSGFVIANAYSEKMSEGLSARAFLYRRAIRLWPMLALGALLGIVLHGGHAGSLMLVPNFKSPTNLFPTNPALWSLLFEVLAYTVFAFGGRKLRVPLLATIVFISAGALVLLVSRGGLLVEFGAQWQALGGGFARLGFGFAGGMLLWHLHTRAHVPARRVTSLAWAVPALFVALVMAVPSPPAGLIPLATLVLFPVLVWLALRWEAPQQWLAKRLGDLSYPLYCIHMPLLATFVHDLTSAVAMALCLPFVALALDRFVDRPARAALSRWLAPDAGLADQTRIGIST